MFEPAPLIVVMGVSGCGKTTIGRELARRLGVPFLDGDDFHPPANKEKMRQGIPLTDRDRWPWLAGLAAGMTAAAASHGRVVAACSALKRAYRDVIAAEAGQPVCFLHLKGSQDLILARIGKRHHEYMPASLLDSQVATLEEPALDENAVAIDIDATVDDIVGACLNALSA